MYADDTLLLTKIQAEEQLEDLGTTVSEDGRIGRELGRRLGVAHADFSVLVRLWKHTSNNQKRKLDIFQAVVTSRLLYSLVQRMAQRRGAEAHRRVPKPLLANDCGDPIDFMFPGSRTKKCSPLHY